MSDPASRAGSRTGSRAVGNPFGVWEAAFGLVVGFLLAILAMSAYSGLSHGHPNQIGTDIADFVGLWTGFLGAAVVASRTGGLGPGQSRARSSQARSLPPPARERERERERVRSEDGRPPAATAQPGSAVRHGSFVDDYGLRFRWRDVPLGIAIGVGAQYLLVPFLELPLQPFVHNLNAKLSHPAQQLLSPVQYNTASLVILAVLVCVGSPLVEEIFFRGLLLRGLLGRFEHLGPRAGPALSIVITGIVFGLVHFEALQFFGLAGFGMLLAYVAYRTGRLGPTILAHVAFNTTTIIAFVLQH
ncbi:MAG TPA: CPBP family intramembrane glutamic endopeptidase [Acidimicrobiales bacterium]|nr:CPBP family intramembrane glutamic endopeptidase [Acidimicrobiales bacterium]